MNWEYVESKWEQLMASAKENWAKLSDDDFRRIAGKREQLAARSRKHTESPDEKLTSNCGTEVRAWNELRRRSRRYSRITSNKAACSPRQMV